MSEEKKEDLPLEDGSGAASAGDGATERQARRKRGPMKVVDRRFWAREQRDGEQESDSSEASVYPKYVEELQAQLEESRGRLRELTVAYRQTQQETDEIRQRLNRDLDRRVSLAKGDLFRELVDVVDNLERALGSVEKAPQANDLARGVDQVLLQMRRLLTGQGVEEIEVANNPFDPEVAEAIEVRAIERAEEDGVVIEVVQRGYRYSGRTLRPARVVVGRAVVPEEAKAQPAEGEVEADESVETR